MIEYDGSEANKGNEVCSEGSEKDEKRTKEEGGKSEGNAEEYLSYNPGHFFSHCEIDHIILSIPNYLSFF